MKKKFLLGGLLVVAAIVTVFAASKTEGTCSYRVQCVPMGDYPYPGQTTFYPVYCTNPVAWPFGDGRCYAHWGVTQRCLVR